MKYHTALILIVVSVLAVIIPYPPNGLSGAMTNEPSVGKLDDESPGRLSIVAIDSGDVDSLTSVSKLVGVIRGVDSIVGSRPRVKILNLNRGKKNFSPKEMETAEKMVIDRVRRSSPDLIVSLDRHNLDVAATLSTKLGTRLSCVGSDMTEGEIRSRYGDVELLYNGRMTDSGATQLREFFDTVGFISHTYYVLVHDQSSHFVPGPGTTETANMVSALKRSGEVVRLIPVVSVEELVKAVESLQERPTGVVMIGMDRLYCTRSQKFVGRDEIVGMVVANNGKHVELVEDYSMVRELGACMSIGSSRKLEVEKALTISIDKMNGRTSTAGTTSTTEHRFIALNRRRCKELGVERLFNEDKVGMAEVKYSGR